MRACIEAAPWLVRVESLLGVTAETDVVMYMCAALSKRHDQQIRPNSFFAHQIDDAMIPSAKLDS
jgi:gluconate kinase